MAAKSTNYMHRLAGWMFSRNAMPRGLVMLADLLVVFFAFVFMHVLRIDIYRVSDIMGRMTFTYCFFLLFFLISFFIFRTYKGVLRYSTIKDLARVGAANAVAMAGIFFIRWVPFLGAHLVPVVWEELLGAFIIATAFMWALRIAVKYVYEHTSAVDSTQRVFIFGVHQGGLAIANGLHEALEVVAFLTDNPSDTLH